MRTLHQTLHLQHHRHTGKMLHHRHTSYHGLLVVFLIAGVFILGLSELNHAAAETFGVEATVAVPVPTTAPLISEPTANENVANSSVLVIGSCPLVTPQVIVSISVDGIQAGTGACDSSNDFSVPVTLNPGSHKIVAGSITIDEQKGPSSIPLTVVSTASVAAPVPISSDSSFIYADGRDITWAGTIGNGTSGTDMYVHVDWGDNSQSNYTVKPGPQSFNHQYATLASHNVLINAANKMGASSSIQIAEAGYSTASFPQASAPVMPYSDSRTVIGLYGLYVSALSVTAIIWLEAVHAARMHQHATI
jgi:hypothetical protein